MPPLIYIAALRRSGSKMLAGALTNWPHSYVFLEPQLPRGWLRIGEPDRQRLASHAIDLDSLIAKSLSEEQSRHERQEIIRDTIFSSMNGHVYQLGIKEIRHNHWQTIPKVFGDVRFVLLARDPRDIYISLSRRARKKRFGFKHEITPENVADDLRMEFGFQRQMMAAHDCMKVRYEDLCLQPDLMGDIQRFVESPSTAIGELDATQLEEANSFGNVISEDRVRRFERELEAALRKEAEACFDLLPEFNAFWGYDKA